MLHIDSNDLVLKRYLEDIRKTTPLSREVEAVLLKNKNDPIAKQKIINANMRFVVKVAIQYRGCPIPIADLVSEGSMGLMRAIETFDDTRGIKFITYGVWWIKAYITKAINEHGNLVRLPANQHLRIRKGLKEQAKGQDVSEDVKNLIQMSQKGVSLDGPLKADSKSSYAETLPDASAIDPEVNSEMRTTEENIRNMLKILPYREYNVLSGLYGVGFEAQQTLREVGEAMNISHERVRQLRDQALRRIKHAFPKEYLKENLDVLARTKHKLKH